MKTQRKALVEELLRTLAPHLAGVLKENNLPGKALTKTIHQLAEQLLRAQAKRLKRAQQALTPQATQVRLTDALTAALDGELATTDFSGKSGKKAKQAIADSAGHLATRLAKLRHKRASKESLELPPADSASILEVAPATKRPASPKRPQRRPPSS